MVPAWLRRHSLLCRQDSGAAISFLGRAHPCCTFRAQNDRALPRFTSTAARSGGTQPRLGKRTSLKHPKHMEPPEKEQWQTQKAALKTKFDEGWQPRKRLSPDAMDGIRTLHAQDPSLYSTPYLAARFEVSPEAIRRILKSKWRPTEKEAEQRYRRWERRGQSVWDRWAELGYKPPKRWRDGAEDLTTAADSISVKEAAAVSSRPARRARSQPSLSSRIL